MNNFREMVQNGNGGIAMMNQKLDRYLVRDKLGEGGFGRVFKGRDQQLQRDVAIKILPANNLSLLEGQVVAGIDHPNIVGIYDIIAAHQSHYLIMEYVEGASLLDQHLSLNDILELAIQVCDGLDYLHHHGLTHQDIKPQNILRNPLTGVCKITDFGVIARAKNGEQAIIGTPRYIAPEQRKGQFFDQRADIYSLAQVINVLLEKNEIKNPPLALTKILAKASHQDYRKRHPHVLSLKGEFQQLLFNLPSWNNLDRFVIKNKPRFNQEFFKSLFYGIFAAAILYILLQNDFLMANDLYPPIFQTVIGPLMAGIVGFLSLPLAAVLVFILLFPPLFLSWPSLGIAYLILILSLATSIFRYPIMFLSIALLTIWELAFIWLVPVIAGYHYGVFGGLVGGLFLPWIQFIVKELPNFSRYQRALLTPNSISENSRWLLESLQEVSLLEIYELSTLTLRWLADPNLPIVILGGLMGVGAYLVGRRGNLGIILYLIVTGLVVAFSLGHLLWHWLGVMTILIISIRLVNTQKSYQSKTKFLTFSSS